MSVRPIPGVLLTLAMLATAAAVHPIPALAGDGEHEACVPGEDNAWQGGLLETIYDDHGNALPPTPVPDHNPVPGGAVVSGFTMFCLGKRPTGGAYEIKNHFDRYHLFTTSTKTVRWNGNI